MFTQEPQFYGDFVESLKPPYFFFASPMWQRLGIKTRAPGFLSHQALLHLQHSHHPVPWTTDPHPTDLGWMDRGSRIEIPTKADGTGVQPVLLVAVALQAKWFRWRGRCFGHMGDVGYIYIEIGKSQAIMVTYDKIFIDNTICVWGSSDWNIFSKTMGWNRWNGVPYFLTKPRVSFSAECIWKIKGKKLEVLRNTGLLLRLCLLAPYTLVGGLEHLDYFSHHIGNFIIPTDELIFFRGVGQPPTRYSWFIIVLPA